MAILAIISIYTMVEFQEVRKLAMTESTLDPNLFNDSPEPDELYGFELQDDLTEEEIEEALEIADKRRFLRGTMIVTGGIGSGKDLFGNVLSYKIKRYFKNRTVLRDEKARKLYGYYEPGLAAVAV